MAIRAPDGANKTDRTNLELANIWLYFLGLKFADRLYLLWFKWFCWGYKITNLPLNSSHSSHFPSTAGQLLIRPLQNVLFMKSRIKNPIICYATLRQQWLNGVSVLSRHFLATRSKFFGRMSGIVQQKRESMTTSPTYSPQGGGGSDTLFTVTTRHLG